MLNLDAHLGRATSRLGDLFDRGDTGKRGNVKPRITRNDLELLAKLLRQTSGESGVPGSIDPADLPHVPGEFSIIDEARQCCLKR